MRPGMTELPASSACGRGVLAGRDSASSRSAPPVSPSGRPDPAQHRVHGPMKMLWLNDFGRELLDV